MRAADIVIDQSESEINMWNRRNARENEWTN